LGELQDIIDAAKLAGAGAWQMSTRLKAVELQGKFLKMWTEKVEVGLDDALMERLLQGRKRAGLPTPEPPAPAALPVPLEGEE
jgi:hypothetical protein